MSLELLGLDPLPAALIPQAYTLVSVATATGNLKYKAALAQSTTVGGGAGMLFRGPWQPATSYAAYDVFTAGGQSYFVIEPFVSDVVFAPVHVTLIAAKGDAGGPGVSGPPGPVGPAGPPGESGPAGAGGATGASGATGSPGAPGPSGPQGLAGSNGAQGAKGDQGPQGPSGASGASGPAGAPGTPGAQGATGPQGPKGDAGAQGPMGAPGSGIGYNPRGAWVSNTAYAIGDVVTYQGSSYVAASAFTSGSAFAASNWMLQALAGSPGVKGDTGAPGAQGPAGAKGDTGATGVQGATGAQGVVGAPGTQGPAGAKGDTGATGASGPAGAPGAAGAQGPAGAKGDTGAQGPTGPVGSTPRIIISGSAATLAASDFYSAVNQTTPAAITLTLPAAPIQGQPYVVVDWAGAAAASPITMAPNTGQTIRGDAVIADNNGALTLIYFAALSGWLVVA